MYKENLTLNNLQWLICHKNKPNKSTHRRTSELEVYLQIEFIVMFRESIFWVGLTPYPSIQLAILISDIRMVTLSQI